MIGRFPPTLTVVAFLESFSWASRVRETDPMTAVVRKSRRDQVMNASGKMLEASERIARAAKPFAERLYCCETRRAGIPVSSRETASALRLRLDRSCFDPRESVAGPRYCRLCQTRA